MTNEEMEFKFTQVLYKPLFDKLESSEILKITETLNYEAALIGDTTYDKNSFLLKKNFDIKRDEVRVAENAAFTVNKDTKWVTDKISEAVIDANNKFFKYDSVYFPGFEVLKYGSSGRFDWHMDSGGSYPFNTRKISVIVFLSDRNDYQGGDLEFLPELEIPMEQGSIVMFASHKLHRVTPVISGIRKTMVTWGYSE